MSLSLLEFLHKKLFEAEQILLLFILARGDMVNVRGFADMLAGVSTLIRSFDSPMFEGGSDGSEGAEEVGHLARGVPLFPMDSMFFDAIMATLWRDDFCVLFEDGHSGDFVFYSKTKHFAGLKRFRSMKIAFFKV